MLIAPIFKVDYLSKQTESQNNSRIKDVSANRSSDSSSSTYNIFKTAINRGTELIRSTFLSSSKGSQFTQHRDSANTAKSTISVDSENEDSDSSSSESSSCDSKASSPDSIQTELMFFKPILREPRTSSSNDVKILRVPSIRSTSSTSTIQTPCPSPFFIPISKQRQSAFSFVNVPPLSSNLTETYENIELKKPKTRSIKRRNSENKKSDGSSSKRLKNGTNKMESKNSRNKTKTEQPAKQTGRSLTTKTKQQSKAPAKKSSRANPKKTNESKEEFRRVTRSMKQ